MSRIYFRRLQLEDWRFQLPQEVCPEDGRQLHSYVWQEATTKCHISLSNHPELDLTEFLNEDDTQKYQLLISSMQWAISLGRFDIQTAVMTLSGFRCAPRLGHMECDHRVCGYLYKI